MLQIHNSLTGRKQTAGQVGFYGIGQGEILWAVHG